MPKTLLQCLIVVIAVGGATQAIAQEFAEDSTLRGEQLFPYDDQDPWKHGYIQVMPFYGGYHSFRPYNYKHVYAQSAQAAQWGVPAQAPYSQQFWHKYESRTDLSMNEFAPTPRRVSPAGFSNGITTSPAPLRRRQRPHLSTSKVPSSTRRSSTGILSRLSTPARFGHQPLLSDV